MKRRWLGILIICALTFPSLAQGQCRKRILVYLDVSGSMEPLGRGTGSPFQQTVTSLEALFRQEGFIEKSDVVRAVRFGKSVEQVDTAEGPEQVGALIQKLRNNGISRSETDFRAAFTDLAQELPKGVFDRQVVLFASDLAHEPRNRMPASEAIPDWRDALSEAKAGLAGRFDSGNAVVVLFVPGAKGTEPQKTAREVLADFRASFPVVGQVGSAAGEESSVENLTTALRRGLLTAPALQVSRDSTDPEKLVVTITNDNCVPLHVKRITVKPEGGEPAYFDDFTESEKEVGSRTTSQRTREIRRKVPPGGEWDNAGLDAHVETEEGVEGQSGGTSGSWLRYKVASAVFEKRPLLPDILRLDLDLMGFTDPATPITYSITFGDNTGPVAQARFQGPALSSTSTRHFRAVLPMKIAGVAASGVRTSIEGSELLEERGDQVNLLEDKQSTNHLRVLGIVALAASVAVLLFYLWVRSVRSRYPIFELSRWDNGKWTMAAIAAFLLLVFFCARITILNYSSPEAAERWLGVMACVFVFGLTAFLLLEFSRTQFAQSVIAEKTMSLSDYLRRGRLDTWLPWITGVVLAAFVFALLWVWAPAGSGESRRGDSEAHERLHVTSD
ncbi:MAG: hypothetical protein ABUT39_27320 [Acidobacteriota bacterium]